MKIGMIINDEDDKKIQETFRYLQNIYKTNRNE